MDKPHLRPFVGGGGGVSGGGGDYSQIGGSDSDDSRSSISRSDDNDNEGLPNIIYTSDDSADAARSDSTICLDSEALGYIAHHVRLQDDQTSQRLLLDSGCPSPQPSPQPGPPCFPLPPHPLASIAYTAGSEVDMVGLQKEGEECFVAPHHSSSSISSNSSRSSPEAQHPLLPEYHPPEYQPLPDFVQFGGVEYEPLQDSLPTKKMHDPLDMFVDVTDIPKKIQPLLGRVMVGPRVHIDARYQDAFYVSWNWNRIRQACVLLNLSVLLSLLCVGIGLLVQMPQGSECDPEHAWWQGSVMYEVYVPSFHDTDGDGIGDLPGVAAKLDYIQSLGVRAVRLNSILEADNLVSAERNITNHTAVDPSLGTTRDLADLAAHLHQRHMHLLLDLPLTSSTGLSEQESVSLREVAPVLQFWLSLGVDGFFFPDITAYAADPGLVEGLHQWRELLDRHSAGLDHKVLMAPLSLLTKLRKANFPHLDHLLHQLHLIHAPVNLTASAQVAAEVLALGAAWDSHASLPWINWNMGGEGRPRVGAATLQAPLGRAILLLFFPGTITLYYGDELNLSQDQEWWSLMAWTPEEAHAGFTAGSPWMSLAQDWPQNNVVTQNQSIAVLANMVATRQRKVPIYVNGIFNFEGDYHPKKSSNYRLRYVDQDLIVVDRFYPRRNQYAVVANLGAEPVTTDLSRFYFGGSVLASSHGHTGYVVFRNISLQPGEALACILDL